MENQRRTKEEEVYQESLRDKITLSPIDKYVKYNRFPTKFVLSIALVILTTVAAVNMGTVINSNSRAQVTVWEGIAFPAAAQTTPTPHAYIYYTLQDMQAQLLNIVNSFRKIDETIYQQVDTRNIIYYVEVDKMFPLGAGGYSPLNSLRANLLSNDPAKFYIDNINEPIKSPFDFNDTQKLKGFIGSIKKFSFNADRINLTVLTKSRVLLSTCWNVSISFDFSNMASILSLVEGQNVDCVQPNSQSKRTRVLSKSTNDVNEFMRKRFFEADGSKVNPTFLNSDGYNGSFSCRTLISVDVLVLIFAFVSMFLNFQYIYEMMNIYMVARLRSKKKIFMKRQYTSNMDEDDDAPVYTQNYFARLIGKGEKNIEKLLEAQKPWDELTLREKVLFFDLWLIIALIANFFEIWSALLGLLSPFFTEGNEAFSLIEPITGAACFLAWIAASRYLEYYKSPYICTTILKNAGMAIIRFMIGFFPIFMAYVFFGVAYFWRLRKWGTVNQASLSLFSIILGDMINDTFMSLRTTGVIGQIYTYTYIFLFVVCVHNVFVTILCTKGKPAESQPETASNQQDNSVTGSPSMPAIADGPKGGEINEASVGKKDSFILAQEIRYKLERKTTQVSTEGPGLVRKNTLGGKSRWDRVKKRLTLTPKGVHQLQDEPDERDEVKSRIRTQIAAGVREAIMLVDEMKRDAIDDLSLYNLTQRQRALVVKKYNDYLDYILTRIKYTLKL